MIDEKWFVLDEVEDRVLLLSPDGRFVLGRFAGRLGDTRPARAKGARP